MPIVNTSYNNATAGKWLFVVPFQKIDPQYGVDRVSFNLTRFSLPEMSMTEASFAMRGMQIPLPGRSRNDQKTIPLNYMLSSDWHQMKWLYRWFKAGSNESGGADKTLSAMTVTTSLFLLSEFKAPVFRIDFFGSWLQSIGGIEFDYQRGEEQIQHQFTLKYAYYEVKDL